MTPDGRTISWLSAALGMAIVTMPAWVSMETMARLSLRDAEFSHQTYWKGWPCWSVKRIYCADRNITNFRWIPHFPNLEELRLVAGMDNCNHFPSLQPFTDIQELRVLELTGVYLNSWVEFPSFPLLEEAIFWESNLGGRPTEQDLAALKSKLPRIRKFEWRSVPTEPPIVRYDSTSGEFVWVPRRPD
jgi:hypothetical protein